MRATFRFVPKKSFQKKAVRPKTHRPIALLLPQKPAETVAKYVRPKKS